MEVFYDLVLDGLRCFQIPQITSSTRPDVSYKSLHSRFVLYAFTPGKVNELALYVAETLAPLQSWWKIARFFGSELSVESRGTQGFGGMKSGLIRFTVWDYGGLMDDLIPNFPLNQWHRQFLFPQLLLLGEGLPPNCVVFFLCI